MNHTEPALLVRTARARGQEQLTFEPPTDPGPDAGDLLARPGAWHRELDEDGNSIARGGAAIGRAIREHLREHARRPVVLLSGPLDEQAAFCARELHHRRLRPLLHLVLCIGEVRHPFAFPAPSFFAQADAIVVATTTARDAVERQLGDTPRAHRPALFVVPHSFDLPAIACHDAALAHDTRQALGIPGDPLLIAAPFRRASRWSAFAFQFFKLWAEGRFGDCPRCGARVIDVLHPEVPQLRRATACTHCAHADLVPGPRRDDAILVQHELGPQPGTPDPDVLAQWLGLRRTVVLRGDAVPGEPGTPSWSRVLAMADVSLIPADNVFPDALVPASVACGTPCLTTDFGLRPSRTPVSRCRP